MNIIVIRGLLLLCIACRTYASKRSTTVNKDGKRPVYCKCGEKIVRDGKHDWIQKMVGSNETVGGLEVRLIFFTYTKVIIYMPGQLRFMP